MRINITMTKEEYNLIKSHCIKEGRTVSGYLRRLAIRDIKNNGTEYKIKAKWSLFG